MCGERRCGEKWRGPPMCFKFSQGLPGWIATPAPPHPWDTRYQFLIKTLLLDAERGDVELETAFVGEWGTMEVGCPEDLHTYVRIHIYIVYIVCRRIEAGKLSGIHSYVSVHICMYIQYVNIYIYIHVYVCVCIHVYEWLRVRGIWIGTRFLWPREGWPWV